MKTRRSFLTVGAAAGIGALIPRKSKAVPVVCGPVCTIALLVVVLGIAIYILVKALKGCEKLKKDYDRNHPDDPDGTGVEPVPKAIVLAPNIPPLPNVNHQDATCADISDSGYTDPNGNPYCVVIDTYVEHCNMMGDPWQEACKVETYLSFATTQVMQWVEPYGYIYLYAHEPTGCRTNYYRNGELVGTQFSGFTNWGTQAPVVQVSDPQPTTPNSHFFKVRSPIP